MKGRLAVLLASWALFAGAPAPRRCFADGAAAARRDLRSIGLPLSIALPPCAQHVQQETKLPPPRPTAIFTCAHELAQPYTGFAIEILLARELQRASEIETRPGFVRWTRRSAGLLVWEEQAGTSPVTRFIVHERHAGEEYVCFNQFGAVSARGLAAEIAACRSIRAVAAAARE